jgi:hypothetical protein
MAAPGDRGSIECASGRRLSLAGRVDDVVVLVDHDHARGVAVRVLV